MAEDKPQVTSAAEYREKFATKYNFITLPSGATFKLRKLQALDFITSIMLPINLITSDDLDKWKDLTEEERSQVLTSHMTPEKNVQLAKQMLLASIVSPKVVDSENPGENEISLSEINMADQLILSQEIAKLNAIDKESGESIRPFRT